MDLFLAFLIHALVGRGLAIALMMTFMVIVSVTVRNTVRQTLWALKAGGDIRQYRSAPVLTQAALLMARRARRTGLPSDKFYPYAREAEPRREMGFDEGHVEHYPEQRPPLLLPQYTDSTLEEAKWDDLEWLEELDYNNQYWCSVCAKKHSYWTGCIPNHGRGWKFLGDRQLGYNDLFGYDEYRWPGEDDEDNNEVTWEGRHRGKKGWRLNYGPVAGVSSKRYEFGRYVRGGRYTRRLVARADR